MPAGEPLGYVERRRLEEAVAVAERVSGLTFSLFVGPAEVDARRHAERLHGELMEPATSVLVLCDPERRALEILTGAEVRRVLDDFDCRLAAASMQTSFQAGDLLGGLVIGVQQLGQAARQPRTLHTKTG